MKRIFTIILASLLVMTAVTLDVSAAKKSAKLNKDQIQQMSDQIDNLTKKIYGRALLSPEDTSNLMGIKIKLDNQMLISSNAELAPLYYKAGNIYKLRGMKAEAVDCYQTILENFSDTALAPKARAALGELGVVIAAPKSSSDESGEDM